jgi:hypothetical protein
MPWSSYKRVGDEGDGEVYREVDDRGKLRFCEYYYYN